MRLRMLEAVPSGGGNGGGRGGGETGRHPRYATVFVGVSVGGTVGTVFFDVAILVTFKSIFCPARAFAIRNIPIALAYKVCLFAAMHVAIPMWPRCVKKKYSDSLMS